MTKTMMTGMTLAAMLLAAAPLSAQSRDRAVLQAERAAFRAEQAAAGMHKRIFGTQAALMEAQAAVGRVQGTMAMAQVARVEAGRETRIAAPAPWIQEDPGARAYQAAREALNARKYREAATAFASLRSEHPSSGYVADSFYYQAFALSRVGDRAALQQAAELLVAQGERHPQAATRGDARELGVRIEAQLARRGDANAAAAIARQAADPCGDESGGTRAAALSALMNMNAEAAIPILKEVLQTREGACSAELRRQAVFLLSQKMDDESVAILLDLAHRNPDPDPEVREQAVFWLSQVQSDEALDALMAILRESKDAEVQEMAMFAIGQHGSERGVEVLRQYAQRADAPTELRENAIFWIGQNAEAGGTQYLIQLYPSLTDPELKERAIFAIAQGNNAESRRWLLARAQDRAEGVEVRKNALFWAGQTGGLTNAEVKTLYGSITDPEMKEQLIFVASQRNDAGAVEFLMDVARTETDGELKELAIFWLGQSKDPRVAEFLLSLIRG
ncbi:MAG TPA: HEAT repeat domain-containing protein [Longimicrobiales bacterium]|nr:HEAT repeat domain-containing protein [Longimicrobiales bacterium]